MVQGYCTKEKKKCEILNGKYMATANGGCRVAGTCKSCGGKMSVMCSLADAPSDVRAKAASNKASYKRKRGSGTKKRRRSGRKSGIIA